MKVYFTSWSINNLNYSLKHTSNLRDKEEVSRRLDILDFKHDFGIKAAIRHSNVSARTIYRWQRALNSSRRLDRTGKASLKSLDPTSTKPKSLRLAIEHKEEEQLIVSILTNHPTIGRRKVYILVKRALAKQHKLISISISTIGRLINRLRCLGRLANKARLSLNGKSGKLHTLITKQVSPSS